MISGNVWLEKVKTTSTGKLLKLSTEDFEHSVDVLADAVHEQKDRIALVAISRGGLPLGTYLSHKLGVDLTVCDIEKPDTSLLPFNKNLYKISIDLLPFNQNLYKISINPEPNRHKNIVIVDDIYDSGQTMTAVSDVLRRHGYCVSHGLFLYDTVEPDTGTKTAAELSFLERQTYTIHSAFVKSKGEWVKFPWET